MKSYLLAVTLLFGLTSGTAPLEIEKPEIEKNESFISNVDEINFERASIFISKKIILMKTIKQCNDEYNSRQNACLKKKDYWDRNFCTARAKLSKIACQLKATFDGPG